MSEMKKKLDALLNMPGMSTGARIKKPAPESIDDDPLDGPEYSERSAHLNENDEWAMDPPLYESDDDLDAPTPPPAAAKADVAKLRDLLQSKGLKTGSEWQQERATNPPPPRRKTRRSETSPSGVNRLRDMTDLLSVSPAHDFEQSFSAPPLITQEEREDGTFELENVIPGEVIGDDECGFYLIRHDYPLDHRQGIVELGSALQSKSKHIAFSACDPALDDFDPRTAVFVDTETTGLSGGTGTIAFLIGVGYFIDGAFRLDQCIMRDFDDEEPMLHYLAELFDKHETLVSYNGKSFDLPLLRTRFIQNRIPFRDSSLKHLDLVHAARRFWKQRLKDCSLGNIEREILSIHREGDVPSHLIPQIWFNYLEQRDARPLEGVISHHEMDILSLVSLTSWMSQCLDAPPGQGFAHLEDKLAVVRIHYKQKNYDEVMVHGRAFLDEVDESPLCRECLEMLGFAYKRREQWEDSQATWEKLLEAFPADPVASHELAKHHEHRTRDLAAAARLCKEALTHYATREGSAGLERNEARAFRHRLERIEKKLKKRGGELEF